MHKSKPNRTAQIVVKMRPHELQVVDRAAEQEGVWRSEFARNALVAAAHAALRESTPRPQPAA